MDLVDLLGDVGLVIGDPRRGLARLPREVSTSFVVGMWLSSGPPAPGVPDGDAEPEGRGDSFATGFAGSSRPRSVRPYTPPATTTSTSATTAATTGPRPKRRRGGEGGGGVGGPNPWAPKPCCAPPPEAYGLPGTGCGGGPGVYQGCCGSGMVFPLSRATRLDVRLSGAGHWWWTRRRTIQFPADARDGRRG
ncbi:hypothetical protein [Streptomyces parvus]|uniref:hypothetical protein n=1 Tax=Streptomyces parvus TaxID=66428 RepID=UPI00363357D8